MVPLWAVIPTFLPARIQEIFCSHDEHTTHGDPAMTTFVDGNDIRGLSNSEAAERLERDGYNELPTGRRRSGFGIAVGVVREPMFLLLIACGALYLILGDLEEALMLLGFVFVVVGITFFQERKTERALEALRDLSSPRALVIREGEKKRIPGREVVTGDVVLLSEGDRVPADAVVRASTNLSADESLLTGESVPVRKTETGDVAAICRPGGEDLPFVYSGTMIVQGQGIAEVLRTGVQTEIGKIGKALLTLDIENTPLQKQTGKLVKVFALAGAALCIAVLVMLGLTKGDWLNGLLAGLTLGMAMLPEEFQGFLQRRRFNINKIFHSYHLLSVIKNHIRQGNAHKLFGPFVVTIDDITMEIMQKEYNESSTLL